MGSSAERRVVIAEDDDDLRYLLAEALADLGYDVVTAASGDDALAIVRRAPFHLTLLLDWFMAPTSGLAVVEALRAEGLDARVELVVMSGSADAAARHLPPHVPCLRKPFGLAELVAALEPRAVAARAVTQRG